MQIYSGDYKQAEYGKVILPFTVLRRLDCLLEESKEEVLKQYVSVKSMPEEAVDRVLNSKSGFKYFHNHSKYDFEKLLAEPDKIKSNLANYIAGFSRSVKEVFEAFISSSRSTVWIKPTCFISWSRNSMQWNSAMWVAWKWATSLSI